MTAYVVYDLINGDGEVIYVGSTGNLALRIRQHSRKPWWAAVTGIISTPYETRDAMLNAEAERIFDLQPRHNTNGGGSKTRATRRRTVHPTRTPAELLADDPAGLARKAAVVAELFA